ncbi:hypothetical protein GOL37_27440 [Sinorhizobium medicae]|nr:hypothetical protein [Sinorhizobium medicae]MDX1022752.1 hypothetical protein [Sinorhizobium medicae]
MRILDIKPAANPGGGQVRLIANFDLELDDNVRMYDLKLMETFDGRRLVYSPNGNGGRRLATFSPAIATAITEAATAKLRGHVTANGTTSQN